MKYALPFSILAIALFLAGFTTTPPTKPEDLGRRLFFDPILSADSTISCASCHIPEYAFSDTVRFSRGVGGRLGHRNAPAITNMSARDLFFLDGRAPSLEQQILMPIQDTVEMRATLPLVTERLRRHPQYDAWFREIYHRPADPAALSDAIAAFIKTLETSNTPFDRYMHDLPNPMSASAIRGREIFMDKGKCFDCHFSPDFTGDEFRNIGLYNGKQLNDPGRFTITHTKDDLGRFKVPGLRNVAVTGPYMHNGMFRTLDDVINYYDDPAKVIPDAINRDPLLNGKLNLTVQDKQDLKAFLEALTDDRFKRAK
jgi:cytochrome c peroxidase